MSVLGSILADWGAQKLNFLMFSIFLFSQKYLHPVGLLDELDLVNAVGVVAVVVRLLEGEGDALAAKVGLELLRDVDHRRLAGRVLQEEKIF